ncbi:MAG: hypothetical protein AAGC67_22605, partial [Myxococcota bacterium]
MRNSTRRARIVLGWVAFGLILMPVSCALLSPPKETQNVACPEQRGTHPELASEKHPDFPAFCADMSHELPTVPFQVCDSTSADLNGDGRLEFLAADHINPAFGYFVNDP